MNHKWFFIALFFFYFKSLSKMKAGMHYMIKLSKIIDGCWPTIMLVTQKIIPKYNTVTIVYDGTDKNYCHNVTPISYNIINDFLGTILYNNF